MQIRRAFTICAYNDRINEHTEELNPMSLKEYHH